MEIHADLAVEDNGDGRFFSGHHDLDVVGAHLVKLLSTRMDSLIGVETLPVG